MTDLKSFTSGTKATLEDYRGYLLCIDGDGQGYTKGMVTMNRSRPGPWEILSFIQKPDPSKKKQNNAALPTIKSGSVVAMRTFHGTFLQVASKNNKKGIPLGTVYAGKDGCWFTVTIVSGRLTLKDPNGNFIKVKSSGKVVCNSAVPSKDALFKLFPRAHEYDDRRMYFDFDGEAMDSIRAFEAAINDLCGRFLLSLPPDQLTAVDRLFFQIEQMWWFYEDHLADYNDKLPHLSQEEFGRQVFRLCTLLQPSYKKYGEFYRMFKQYLSRVPVFGSILLNKKMTKCVLVRSYHGKSWMFPRGKVNEGESHETAACREVLEEIGYDCTKLIKSNEFIQYNETRFKQVTLFIIIGVEEDFNFETRTRKEIGKIKWHEIKDIPLDKNMPGASKFKGVMKAAKILKNWIAGKKKQLATLNKKEKKLKKEKNKKNSSSASLNAYIVGDNDKINANSCDQNKCVDDRSKMETNKAIHVAKVANKSTAKRETILDHYKIMKAFDSVLLKKKTK
eukprot:g5338.t1